MSQNLDEIIKSQAVIKFLEVEHDLNGKITEKKTLAQEIANRLQAVGVEVVGDGNADGTAICTFDIPAYGKFICTHIAVSANVAAMIHIGTGTLAAMTETYFIDLMAGGGFVITSDDDKPLFTIDNSGGAAVLAVIVFAPQTGKNIATNNDNTHYFDAYIGGYYTL